MGTSCSHSRFEDIVANYTDTSSLLWNYETGSGTCADCGNKNMHIYRSIGKITGRTSNWKHENQYRCKHSMWYVDEHSIITKQETTLGGSVMRLFMGAGMDGIQYHNYFGAKASCVFCGKEFNVRSEIKSHWVNKQLTECPTKWAIVPEVTRCRECGHTS